MGVLDFDGTDDGISFLSIDTSVADIPGDGWTFAALIKRDSLSGLFMPVLTLDDLSNIYTSIAFNTSNVIYSDNHGATSAATSHGAVTDTTNPLLIVMTKNSGTALPRLGFQAGSGGTMVFSNYDTTISNDSADSFIEIGHSPIWGEYFNGHIGLVAIWANIMSDANMTALGDNWRTSDWYNSAHGTPVFLSELNVAAGSVVDLTGLSGGLSVAGSPTLDSGETLGSWNFDGIGSGVASAPAVNPTYETFPKYLLAGRRTV